MFWASFSVRVHHGWSYLALLSFSFEELGLEASRVRYTTTAVPKTRRSFKIPLAAASEQPSISPIVPPISCHVISCHSLLFEEQ